ncbi:YesL family protein [Gracilibacillus salinarum]|uniref:DUF624 domain-containing protein n=1 Tax=Gracilibacillus salinarum TaxID=2932255 RepID=A0ABY4GRV3_9BACI|nr:DUF624 domain-containing protein [Gracilibacillus salinarum]UOQ86868.1 DUF624 domain-containing protein [Gracilibacillus salinarum]
MNAVRLTELARNFCIALLKLVYLNLLWFFFMILGLGILGIAPATVALCNVEKSWLEKQHLPSIFREYWNQFRFHFVKSNGLAILLFVIGFVLYFDLKFFIDRGGMFNQTISILLFILSVWFMITVMYILPIYTKYQLKLVDYIKYAFILGMLNPLKTFGMAISAGGMIYLSLYIPQILYSLGISLTCFIVMIITLQAIEDLSALQHKYAK